MPPVPSLSLPVDPPALVFLAAVYLGGAVINGLVGFGLALGVVDFPDHRFVELVEVDLDLPRFGVDTRAELNDPLKALGMVLPFDPAAEKPAMKPIAVPYAETWGAMEALQRSGLVKRIGVCNLNVSMLREVLNTASIRPAVHQFEVHPYLTQERQVRFCQSEGIAVTAFSPLGAPSYLPDRKSTRLNSSHT